MTKTSKCFICSGEFGINELAQHEKICLEAITSNDVQYTREETKDIAPDGHPQYNQCHLCGKLYSKYSKDIHLKQCEQTRARQKNIGTAGDNKIKNRSLADVGEGKYSIARPPTSSSSPSTNTTSRIPVKKSTLEQKENKNRSPALQTRTSSTTKGLSLSTGLDNLSISRRKDMMYSDEVRSKNMKDERSPLKKSEFSLGSERNVIPVSPTGRQKCYLCKQMYGALSLPIHEKQCYAKQRKMKAIEDARTPQKSASLKRYK